MDSAHHSNWPLVILLWLAGLGAAAQYGKISVVFDALPAIYPQAGASLGFAVSLVGAVGIALGVVAGVVVARLGFRPAVLGGLVFGAVLSFAQAFLPPLPLFLALRVLEGGAHLALVVALPTFIAQLTTPQDRGVALTLWGTFFGVAFAILAWFGRPFAAQFGLAALFAAHGVYLAFMAGLLWRLLPAQAEGAARPSSGGVLRAHWRIYSSPWIGAPAVGWLFYTFAFVSVLTVLPPYLGPDNRAWVIGAMPLMSILSSLTLGVWLLRRIGPVGVIVAGFGACFLAALGLILWPGSAGPALALGAALGLVQGASFAAVPELNEAIEARALANGGLAQMGNLGNTIGTPILLWVISGGGYLGMTIVLCMAFLMGGLAHLALARLRARGQS
ncbi:MAG: MFS transporter [Pseudomonadota bacterium]